MLADIQALIDTAASQLNDIRDEYQKTLNEQAISPGLKTRIKNVLENQRSALEYLAHAIHTAYGKPNTKAYYPVAGEPGRYEAAFDRCLPGVRTTRPDIFAEIESHQPYQSGYDWLGHLVDLTNENKHQRLTPQARDETRRIRVDTPGGGRVEWTPAQEGKGGVTFGRGVSIGGVPVDPATQRPVPGRLPVTETVYVDWLFEDPRVSALQTLETIQAELPSVIESVSQVAGL